MGGLEPMENGAGTRVTGRNEMYDPATNTWTERSPMPTARNHAFSGVVNGKIYVIGGRIGAGNIPATTNIDRVEEYDPATHLLGVGKQRMPTPRSGGRGCRAHQLKRAPAGPSAPTLDLPGL